MRFTERDRRLLLWINGHGFVSVKNIAKWMRVSDPFAYARVKKLVDAGYIERERVLHNSKRIHTITKQAKMAVNDELPIPKNVNLGTYIHDSKLVSLSLELEEQTHGSFIPERRIRQLKGLSGVGTKGHIPDGILELPEGKKVAIELELTIKSKERLLKIMKEYAANTEFHEIWYFVADRSAQNAIQKAANQSGVFNLKIMEVSND